MRPHSGSEQVPVRRRGFQPAGAQRRPPALPVQPLQRDEEADRGGRAAVLARDVQGGWAARLAASAPGAAACGGKTGRALAGRPRGRLLVSRVGSTAGQCWQRLSTESAQARPPPAPRALLPARVLPGGSRAPVLTALGARSSGFSAAQSSGVQVWCLLLSGPLGQGLAACGLNGAGL